MAPMAGASFVVPPVAPKSKASMALAEIAPWPLRLPAVKGLVPTMFGPGATNG